MRFYIIALGLLLGCTGKEEEVTPSTLIFLAPAEGATVAAGTVDVTVVVEHFTLEAPAATGRTMHNEGEAEGYVVLWLDGDEVAELSATQGQIEGVTAGAHTLEGELYYVDGDPLEPPVTATVSFSAE